jgi:hypothetical protein
MMITAHKKNRVARLPLPIKKAIALESLSKKQTVANISRRYDCSRNTVYEQQKIALAAANKAFEAADNGVLFYLPVTKDYISGVVVDLYTKKNSHRDIQSFLESSLDYSLSEGSIFNILDAAGDRAIEINNSYALSPIKDSTSDELFHHNRPILATIDIPSRFCALLANADNRDGDTWGIHLLDLQAMGYNPEVSILDGGKGLIKGHEVALPETKLRHDHFHCIMDMKDVARFLRNQVASAATAALKLLQKSLNIKNPDKKKEIETLFEEALSKHARLESVSSLFNTLASWLQHDVLQLAGHPPVVRATLYDFIVSEVTVLAEKHPHRIDVIVTTLNEQRKALLDVANELNDKFMVVAEQRGLSIDTIWKICYLARYEFDGAKYCEASSELESLIGSTYDEVEDDVLHILDTTHRCSSMIENFNSRLRPYLDKRKFISQKMLALIQFYLNHRLFPRSHHERLKHKSPAEALTGQPHKPWREMIGFERVLRKAA